MKTDSLNMHEELFVSILTARDLVPLDTERVAEERRYYEMTPTISGKWSAISDLVGLYTDAGYYDEAILVCKEVLKNPLLKEYFADLWVWVGKNSENKEDFEAALNAYLESIKIGSDNRYLQYWQHNNAGFCFLMQKNFAEAEKHCRIALEIDERTWVEVERRYGSPLNWNAFKNLGAVMEYTGRYHEAASYYTVSIKLSRGIERAVLHLRRLMQRHPELIKWWKEPIEDLLTYYHVVV
ncbi:MAG: tetratricopeptide repeat protein [Candidatus Omnitrophica bacterium]|nr:tetratricopeptide repeat protein [Candidatus Omnitrophota bacterium]